ADGGGPLATGEIASGLCFGVAEQHPVRRRRCNVETVSNEQIAAISARHSRRGYEAGLPTDHDVLRRKESVEPNTRRVSHAPHTDQCAKTRRMKRLERIHEG